MTRAPFLFLVALVGCTSAPPPPQPEVPLRFTALSEGPNRAPCVEGPDFAVAVDEDAWIDVYDRHTACRSGDVVLPTVDFDRRFVVVAWWGVEGCAPIEVRGVAAVGEAVVVRAMRGAGGCPSGSSAESIVAVERPAGGEAIRVVRLDLDDDPAGSVDVESGAVDAEK